MKNVFANTYDEELSKIYQTYLMSKEEGLMSNAFRFYGRKIIDNYFTMHLGDAISMAEKMFFEEVANRYFNMK